MKSFKELTDYFQKIGAVEISHSTKSYLAHAIGVYHDLKEWGWDESMARIGLFHSIYGTQLFQRFTLPIDRRQEVIDMIGERAEQICWLNCIMDRKHFDQEILRLESPYQILNRFDGQLVHVTEHEFDDLCVLHLCDWLEQVERSQSWDYRRTAYQDLAARVGGIGEERYREVFSLAPDQQWHAEYDWPPTSA